MSFNKPNFLSLNVVLLVLSLAIGQTSFAMQRSPYGRAVPISFDKNSGLWNVLLAQNTRDNFWNDFGLPLHGAWANVVAQHALKAQTNNLYNVTITQMPWRKNKKTGDFFHFVPVKFIPGSTLYATGRNSYKSDFIWIPAQTIMQSPSNIVSIRNRAITISHGFYNYFKKKWPKIEMQLQQSQTSTVHGIQSGPNSWFQIPQAIYFYDKNKPYYEFTNFEDRYPVLIDNQTWSTTEHYYQAMKFNAHPTIQASIAQALKARDAFSIAQQNKSLVRTDWQNVNLALMLKAVRAKFTQHAALATLLLATGQSVLVEDAGNNDAFFGAGADYKGSNHLGQILMRVRAELRGIVQPQKPYNSYPPSFYQQPGYENQI